MLKKKHSITLLEIMIVIFLIGIIGSAIGYSVKGSLEEGKVFRTEQGAAKIKDILMMESSYGVPLVDVVAEAEAYLKHSGLIKDAKALLKDGWGEPYKISEYQGNVIVSSERLTRFHERKKQKLRKSNSQVDEEN